MNCVELFSPTTKNPPCRGKERMREKEREEEEEGGREGSESERVYY